MDNLWLLYLLTRLDKLNDFVNALTVIAGLGVGVSIIVRFISNVNCDEDIARSAAPWTKRFAVLFVIFGTLHLVMPTKEDVLFIAAGVGITEVAKSEEVKRVASGSVKVLEAWLVKQQQELEGNTK